MPPKVLILFEVFLSNIGGTATIIGDPPNIIIGNHPVIRQHVSFGSFSLHVLPGVLVAVACVYFYLWKFHYHEVSRDVHVGVKLDIEVWKRTLDRTARIEDEEVSPEFSEYLWDSGD
jgi:Na+/H+ antiporter NhaD/arsenite permease-like protein